MWSPVLLADWHGIPEAWIVGIASTATGGVGWLIKHVTSRSAERAAAMNTAASERETANVTLQGRAYDTLEKIVKTLQEDLARQTTRTERIEQDYGVRLAKLERRNGRMNHFIVKLLDAYLQIKAYVSVLEPIVTVAQPGWQRREFPSIELPCFDDDPPDPTPAR